MANLQEAIDRARLAIAHYREAVLLRPAWSSAHYRLANALAAVGQTDEAIAHYSSALEIEPDFVEAHANLGALLARRDRGQIQASAGAGRFPCLR